MHKDFIFNFGDFIEVCKSMSLQSKEEFGEGVTHKEFNTVITDLDKQILKYRNHLKKEEEKIDMDFDQLI
jgi:hypothetical protein